MYTRMALVYVMTAWVVTICVRSGHGSMMNKCMKVLAKEEFHKPCSMLGGNHIRPCLVKTQQDADVLIGAKVIGDRTPIPRNHICAARKEMRDADCISVHVHPNTQQAWQWTEWRTTSYGDVRNFAITEGGTDYTCPYEERRRIYTDCQEAYLSGERTSGVYTISPDANTALNVYCEQELDGGGWTVFQTRQDGSWDFYRNWTDYEAGFGDLAGEHWLGNDYIHLLTKNHDQRVKFRLQSWGREWASADYDEFWTADANDNYRLHIAGFSGANPPGDSMFLRQNGQMFTTKDRDNDMNLDGNCAVDFTGAWWYKWCHASNLNGIYGSTDHAKGLSWQTWKGHYKSMRDTAIMLRRK